MQTHRRQVAVGERRGEVARRVDERAPGPRDGDPQGVVDRAVTELLVAREAGEDRQAGGVGGGPAGRPQPVREQAPGGSGAGSPARAALERIGREELPQPAAVAVDDEDVAVAVAARAALDAGAGRERVRPAVRFVGVVEGDGDASLRSRDDVDGDADRRAVPAPGAEVPSAPTAAGSTSSRATRRCASSAPLSPTTAAPRARWPWRVRCAQGCERNCPRPTRASRSRPGRWWPATLAQSTASSTRSWRAGQRGRPPVRAGEAPRRAAARLRGSARASRRE